MLQTTLNAIREHSPCAEGWEKLLDSLGKTKADDEPLEFEHILESNGLDHALWALRALSPEDAWIVRKYAVCCARRVERLMKDERSINALNVAALHARGEATDEDLAAARDAAWAAARDAAWSAAWNAERASAQDAAWSAARDAAWNAGDAAWAAARAAARDAARDAEREWQAEEFRRMCSGEGAYASRTAEG